MGCWEIVHGEGEEEGERERERLRQRERKREREREREICVQGRLENLFSKLKQALLPWMSCHAPTWI
jgi:hypothetical protein